MMTAVTVTGRSSQVRTPRARRLGALAIVGALALAVSACGGGGRPEVAAKVEGVPIASDRIDELFNIFAGTAQGAAELGGPDGQTLPPKQVRATALTYQIRVTFLDYLATRENIVLPTGVDNSELYNEFAGIGTLTDAGFRGQDLAIAARAEAISKAIAAKLLPEVTVSETELQAAFDERKDIVGESFRASTNIAFMDDQTSADMLKAELEDGVDFTKAVSALGEKTLTAETVDVNPLSPLPPAFIEVVKGLKVGDVAEPIQYDFEDGAVYVVLQQTKREDLPALTLDQARPELAEIVKDKKRLAVFEQWFEKQFAAAKVDVDGYYGKWNPSFQAVT